MNRLYYGDNLDVLRRHVDDESVDLVYLDPPFKSSQNYNVLFAEHDGTQAASQIKVFTDTWTWDQAAARSYEEVVERGGRVSQAMQAFRTLLGESDMLAYLAMMAPRLLELRNKLKPTGSLYLHCDPTASHYLKLLLDATFGVHNFRSEIIWKRSSAHNDAKQGRKIHGHIHDVILFYTRAKEWTWNDAYTPYAESYVGRDYALIDEASGKRFRRGDLTAARPGGDTEYEWRVKKRAGMRERWVADLTDEYANPKSDWEYKGVHPYKGRFWAYSKENMRQFAIDDRLRHTFDGMPEYKHYLNEMPGVPLQDIWTDINPIIAGTAERLGYQTQKPEALLERIIETSTNEGDTVLDPFCGCGTAVIAAEKLKRRWIGIDITSLAVSLIRVRLTDTFGGTVPYEVIGEPVSIPDAAKLAQEDPYQFQWWALGQVGARPTEQKKGADRGIDGRIYFHVGDNRTHQIILSVKAGHVWVSHVRDLRGVLDREKAEMGVLISLEETTSAMRKEAASAGFYSSPWGKHPRLQLITIDDLLTGKTIDRPPVQASVTFKRAPKDPGKVRERGRLDFGGPEPDQPF